MTTIKVDDLRPGDLLFLTAVDGDALGRMITALDGSPYSHVGLVADAGVLVSARTQKLVFDDVDDIDFGGVRLNGVTDLLANRRAFAARPDPTVVDPDTALTCALSYLELGAEDRSGFSFVKLCLVAMALNALRRDEWDRAGQAMYEAVAAAGGAWDSTAQRRLHQQPSFFCSEFVAAAFDRPFAVGDLRTHDGVDHMMWPGELERLVERLTREVGRPSRRQLTTLARATATVARHDPAFLGRVAKALYDLLKQRLPSKDGDAVADAPTDAASAPQPTDPVPWALVTPRMLLNAEWVDKCGDVVT